MARALIGASVGDEVKVQTPAGTDRVEVLAVSYPFPGPA
jgi:transcription elongation GreA/GreB family factor